MANIKDMSTKDKLLCLCLYGYTFLRIWVTRAHHQKLAVQTSLWTPGIMLQSHLLTSFSYCMSLLIIYLLSKKLISEHKNFAHTKTLIASGGLAYVFGSLLTYFGFTIGGPILTGLGTGIIFVCWGQVYSQLKTVYLQHFALAQLIIPGSCFLLAYLPYKVNAAVLLLSPLICVLALYILKSFGTPERLCVNQNSSASLTRPPIQIVIGTIIICFGYGFLQSNTTLGLSNSQLNELSVYTSYLLAACMALFIINRPTDPNYTISLRWICSLLIFGYLLLPLQHLEAIRLLSNIVITCGFFLLEYLILIVFSSLAHYRQAHAFLIFSSGRLLISGSILIGMTIPIIMRQFLPTLNGSVYYQVITILFVLMLSYSAIWLVTEKYMKAFIWNVDQTSSEKSESSALEVSFEYRCKRFIDSYKLTPKQAEVLNYWARGMTSAYIEEAMCISSNTVATHIKNIYQKADLHSRQELIDEILREEQV